MKRENKRIVFAMQIGLLTFSPFAYDPLMANSA
jgi:hypothetical protein